MHGIKMTMGLALLILGATKLLGAPLPGHAITDLLARQNAGTGAGCDSILTDTDTAVGEGVENAGDNTAGAISGAGAKRRRQLAGAGAGCNSIFSDTDTATGEGVENAEDNTAGVISSGTGAAGGGTGGTGAVTGAVDGATGAVTGATGTGALTGAVNGETGVVSGAVNGETGVVDGATGDVTNSGNPPPPPPKGGKDTTVIPRQLNKIADGADTLFGAAGAGTVGDAVAKNGDSIDGTGINGLAQAGATVGNAELATIPAAGAAVPKDKRQLNKIADGAGTLLGAAGAGTVGDVVSKNGDSIDGTGTSGLANAGATVGNAELANIPAVGAAVPKQ